MQSGDSKIPPTENRRRDTNKYYLNRIMRQTNWIYKGYEVCFSILSKTWYAHPTTALTTEHRVKADSRDGIIAAIDAMTASEFYQPA
jgi:hypothetical protein